MIATFRTMLVLAPLSLGACAQAGTNLCESLPGTAAEIAATPRGDRNLELLALRLSEGVTAHEEVYQRLNRDIRAIRAQFPVVREIQYFAPHDGRGINVTLDQASYRKLQAGDYDAWECLNRHFRAVEMAPSGSNIVTLTLKGRYNLNVVADAYRKTMGVVAAEPVTTLGDGPTIVVTPGEGSTWHYVFDNAGGACVAGCTTHDAHYFTVRENQEPVFIDQWKYPGSSPPPWFERYAIGTEQRWRMDQASSRQLTRSK